MASSSSPSPPHRAAAARRQPPFFRDLVSPIPPHRASRFASTLAPSSTPPPPLVTLGDCFYADEFSPDPTASNLLPIAASPSPRAPAASLSPSWDRSRGKASASGSPMEPARKEVLALPPPSPLYPPRAATAEVRSLVTPAPAPSRTASAHHYDARRALEKNGTQLISGVTIGVKIADPVHRRQVDEKMNGINHRGFMVSLPSKSFVLKCAGASSQLGDFPRPNDPKAGTNVIRDTVCCSRGSVAMPAKSIVTNAMDLIFGI